MQAFFKAHQRKLLASTVVSATGLFVVSDEKRRAAVVTGSKSAYRIGNLLSTVAAMSFDYGYFLNVTKDSADQHRLKKLELLELFKVDLARYEAQLQAIEDSNGTVNLATADTLSDQIGENLAKFYIGHKRDADFLRQRIFDIKMSIENVKGDCDRLMQAADLTYHNLHERNAQRLTIMCAQNGGLYIKLGQHLSMLDYVVPAEYQQELSHLLNATPQSSWGDVCKVVKLELGQHPHKLFDTFEKTPVASASLAQVHVATKDGKKYAVKVQHNALYDGAVTDMAVITKLVALIPRLFPAFDYDFLSREMNRNIPLELNFHTEAENIATVTQQLRDSIARGDVAVPTVHQELSSRRVLTMSYEEGCYVNQPDKIDEMKLDRAQIALNISKLFWEQIFVHGFVHCGTLCSMHCNIPKNDCFVSFSVLFLFYYPLFMFPSWSFCLVLCLFLIYFIVFCRVLYFLK
jgi:hypothetical protein